MHAFSLRTLPVYSELHPDLCIGQMRLLTHQVETLDAVRDDEVDVVLNTAMTGDGKSLGAYLSAFQDQRPTIAMYPTNELMKDQFNALASYEARLGLRLPVYDTMYSDKITRAMRERDHPVRVEEVRSFLTRNRVLLTNPDLVHLIMSHQYGWSYLRKELPVTAGANFDRFLFDEFHVFGVPQVISVINMLGYLFTWYRDRAERKKFLFLSATPNPLLSSLLSRGGLRSRSIEGRYRSSSDPDYRCILQACDLTLHEVDQEHSTERWVEEHLDEIRAFFTRYPGSKGAILVSSVATARRLVELLRARLEQPYGITIGENTGLTSEEKRRESFTRHILVGTSTVDVGVDFHINFLIFEAFNAGTFLQRFGRLGRHDTFPAYQAHALIPRFVLERLATDLKETAELERPTFNEAVRGAFPGEQEFKAYARVWGTVQAAQVLAELRQEGYKDQNAAFVTALSQQYEQFYGSDGQAVMPGATKKYWYLKNKLPQVLAELTSFRGQSPLTCGVWDTTDDHLTTYDLLFLLKNTDFEVLSESDFLQEVRRRKLTHPDLEEKAFADKLLYFKILAYVPERMQLVLGLPSDLGNSPHLLHTLQGGSGFFVREPRHGWLDKVNAKLKRVKLACILTDMVEVKQKLRLGPLFPVHRLQDATGNEYRVTFGQEALLLDSLLFYRPPQGNKPMFA